ncbi:hypothetical protein [Daejeonella oryzae]|uniref:hypothetical protein n=1 Tax=Daejeonella oryzae TaxID=1122943 RepID=UPI0003FF8A87|nr:hypothetical protein [Daejeonella oryzae]
MKTNNNSPKQNSQEDKNEIPSIDSKEGAKHNLSYNKSEGSFEFDVKGEDGEYNHPDPYNTAVKNGGDADSDYDTANPTAMEEYDTDISVESTFEDLGMHIDNGKIVELSAIDAELSHTPEDDRDDLDEEGYPKNDMEKKKKF